MLQFDGLMATSLLAFQQSDFNKSRCQPGQFCGPGSSTSPDTSLAATLAFGIMLTAAVVAGRQNPAEQRGQVLSAGRGRFPYRRLDLYKSRAAVNGEAVRR